MLEGPRADRHGSDNPAFWCRGEAPQLAEGDFTRVGTSRLAPPPVEAGVPVLLAAGRFHDPGKWGESVGTRPDAGMGGKELPARREATGFCGFGKAGTGKAWIFPGRYFSRT